MKMSEDNEIEIVMLDEESSSNDFLSENEQYSAVNQCQSSIDRLTTSETNEVGSPSDISELKNKSEYQTLLKRIKFNIETMSRSELENFCFAKIQSEIESRSMYQCHMKEIKILSDKVKSTVQELAFVKMENLKLLKTLKGCGKNVCTKQYFIDAHVQVDSSDFIKEEINETILPDNPPCTNTASLTKSVQTQSPAADNAHTRRPVIKLRDFCKDKSLNNNQLRNPEMTPLPTCPPSKILHTDKGSNMGLALDNSNPQNLYYLVSVPPGDASREIKLEPMCDPRQTAFQRMQIPTQLSIDGSSQNPQKMLFSFGSNEFSFPANFHHSLQSALASGSVRPFTGSPMLRQPPHNVLRKLQDSINTDIVVKTENLLQIQDNMEGIQSSDSDKHIDIEETLPHALITCKEKSNVQNVRNNKNKDDGKRVEVFKVVRSIDLTDGKRTDAEKSIQSNDQNPFDPTMPLIVSTVSLAPDTMNQHCNDATVTSGLPFIVSTQSLASESNVKTNNVNSVIDNNIVPGRHLNTFAPNTSSRATNTSPGVQRYANENCEMLVTTLPNSEPQQSIGASTPSSSAVTPTTAKTIIRKGINFGIIRPGSYSFEESSNNQNSESNPRSESPSPSTNLQSITPQSSAPELPFPNELRLPETLKHPGNLSLSTVSDNSNAGQSGEPATKKVCLEENWSFDELQRQITDKFYDAFNKGNLANGISIKLDVNGMTKVVTCTNINIASLQKMVDEQNYEKKSFVNVFSRAIFNKINKSVGLEQSKKITIRRCDLLDKPMKNVKNTLGSKNKKKSQGNVIVLVD